MASVVSEMSGSPQFDPRQNLVTEYQPTNIAAGLLQAAAQASGEQYSSGEEFDDAGNVSPDNVQRGEKRKKRSRACQACRNMKIRCNPVEGQESCLACSKVNRECIMPGPARKRQKTVQKVAELEKRINALTQSLLAKTQNNPTPQQSPAITDGSQSVKEATKDSPDTRSNFPLFPKGLVSEAPAAISQLKASASDYEDVIDRGIVSFAIADRIFDKFVTDMNPLCPLVAFPPGTTAELVRRARPLTFTTILAAGCISLMPEIQSDVVDELAKQLAHRVFFIFERSLDLTQALMLHTTWVGKHKVAKDVGFNQYIHAAIVMAHDLGLSKRLKTPLTRDPAEEAELRRTWLSCYWCGMCVSVTLRHPPMIRAGPHIEECLAFFSKSPAALATDATLCSMVKMVHILEDVASSFHMDDPASVVRIQDQSTQYSLKLFEKRIDDWRKEASRHMEPALLNIIDATASLYTHEIALHTNHNIDDFRPPTGRPGENDEHGLVDEFITPSHLDAMSKCVVAMKLALETFITAFPSPTLHSLPCLLIVWTAYCVVAMIRLDGALRASGSKYAEIFLPDLKVNFYLDSIIERLNGNIGSTMSCGPVPMFVQAFQKLRVWHQYRQAGAVPKEYAALNDIKSGLCNVKRYCDKLAQDNDRPINGTPDASTHTATASGSTEHDASIGVSQAQLMQQANQPQQPQQPQQPAVSNSAVPGTNLQGFDTQGGSWLTNSNMPIDASLFENQDWNFTLEDWNNFEASMVQPAGGSWLGYLL